MGTDTPQPQDDARDFLSHIIKVLNDTYGTNLTEDDKVDIERMQERLNQNAGLRDFMHGDNSVENKRYKFFKEVDDLLLDFVNTKLDLYKKLTDPRVNPMFKSKWYEGYQSQAEQM